jgi:galactose mutarotase-like enzyme
MVNTESDATVMLASGAATARIALAGAEPLSWNVAGQELLWNADPTHWGWHAPILFPVVGGSSDGVVRVDGVAYPMPRHGFARNTRFTCVEVSPSEARFRITDTAATRVHYPFAFAFDVIVTLAPATLTLAFEVRNNGATALPYAVGFHPAFAWPRNVGEGPDPAVVFDAVERDVVPTLTAAGLLRDDGRRIPLHGRVLELTPALFADDALVFRDIVSRAVRFVGPSGDIVVAAEDMPHAALWTKPDAPFLCVEAWTGTADLEGFSGELKDRTSIRIVPSDDVARHAVTMTWEPRARPASVATFP